MTGELVQRLLELLAPEGARYNRLELGFRDLPAWAFVLLGGLLAAGLLAYLRGLRRRPAGRPALVALRLLAALLVGVILAGPSLELQQALKIPSRIVVLVDRSRSMALVEGGRSRMERARDMAGRILRALEGRHEVDLYAFDGELQRIGPDELPGLLPTGTATDLSGVLARLHAEDPGRDLAGVIVLSDGRDTARLRSPEDVARRRPEWVQAPLFPVLAARPGELRDLGLADVGHPEFGFVRHPLEFDVELGAHGLRGESAQVTLYANGAPLRTEVVDLPADQVRMPLRFRTTPERPGNYLYAIEARPLPGEALLENNRLEMAVQVARDQVRVLLLCGRPSWDERFLRRMLKKDPNVDLVSFFILRDADDSPGVAQDELSLIPFPVDDLFHKELENFDLVALQNFDRRSFLAESHLAKLREFVERGGGLGVVGGDLAFRAGGYAGTLLEDILPFRLEGGPAVDEGTFSPRLTPAGTTHFITRLEADAEANRRLLAGLPALDGVNLVGPLASGSQALLVHPTLSAGGQPLPVLAVRSLGRGRVLGLTVDSTWYWDFKRVGRGGTNREYLRLWQNAIRWLSHDDSARFVRAETGSSRVEPEQRVELRARARDGDYRPLAGGRVRLRVVRPEGGAEEVREDGLCDGSGVFRVESSFAGEGFRLLRAELVDARGELVDRDERFFEVRGDRAELADPRPHPEILEAMARSSGGRLLAESSLDRPALGVKDTWRLAGLERVDLWDSWLVYAGLLGTLAAEWWLRRRQGLG